MLKSANFLNGDVQRGDKMSANAELASTMHSVNGWEDQQQEADAASDSPFPFGWRTIVETLPNGEITYYNIPLTQADFLNPQLGDHVTQSDSHIKFVISLVNRFVNYYLNDQTVGVFSDLKMLWGIPDEKEPAPDLAIVPNLQDKQKHRSSFDVTQEGTRPCLVVEVMSPQYPGDDTDKVAIYQRVGIAEYIIVKPYFEREMKPMELLGYRLEQGRYCKIQPDTHGRLLSHTTGVWFGLDGKKRFLILTDATTGERLLTSEEEHAARLDAEAEVARLRSLLSKRNGS